MSTAFPTRIDLVTCEWLTRVFRERGLAPSATVLDFSAEPIDSGYTALLYRLCLSFDEAAAAAPRSAVAKFLPESGSVREAFEKYDIYRREVRFYQSIDEHMELPVPACYAAEYDAAGGGFVLLLEDLSAARQGCWATDPVADARTALPCLAAIHARFWGDKRLRTSDWVAKPFESEQSSINRADWGRYLEIVKARHRDQWHDRVWATCERVHSDWDAIMRCMNRDRHTLVHTDAHFGQMFFPTERLPRFVLFDWQNPCKALGAEDLCHLIVNDLSVEQRRMHEAKLVELYHRALCRGGVTELELERLWFQCKLSLMWLILMYLRTIAVPDLLRSLANEADAAGDDWRDWVFGQLGAAISDWQLDSVLDQAVAEGRDRG